MAKSIIVDRVKVIAEMARQNVTCEELMQKAGVGLDQVVKVNVYLTSMAHFDEMNAVYKQMFTEPYPARTCVAVLALPLEADIEIECIVKK